MACRRTLTPLCKYAKPRAGSSTPGRPKKLFDIHNISVLFPLLRPVSGIDSQKEGGVRQTCCATPRQDNAYPTRS